jgi:hypothetical protein
LSILLSLVFWILAEIDIIVLWKVSKITIICIPEIVCNCYHLYSGIYLRLLSLYARNCRKLLSLVF